LHHERLKRSKTGAPGGTSQYATPGLGSQNHIGEYIGPLTTMIPQEPVISPVRTILYFLAYHHTRPPRPFTRQTIRRCDPA